MFCSERLAILERYHDLVIAYFKAVTDLEALDNQLVHETAEAVEKISRELEQHEREHGCGRW